MLRVFVDTSVIFSALYSTAGFARDLFVFAAQDQVMLVISQNVLMELERNILNKAPQLEPAFRQFLVGLNAEVVPVPPSTAVEQASAYVVDKDAPIIAAAILAQVDYLVTYDRKHLLEPPEVAARSGLTIVTPDVVVKQIQSGDSSA
jgi:putative PIN family toxin of toxin-antitoxin system